MRARGHDICITVDGGLEGEGPLRPQANAAINLFQTALNKIGRSVYSEWSFQHKTALVKEFARWHKKK